MSEHGHGIRTCDCCGRQIAPDEQFVTFTGSFGYAPMWCLGCYRGPAAPPHPTNQSWTSAGA